jgi:hypothetical protein
MDMVFAPLLNDLAYLARVSASGSFRSVDELGIGANYMTPDFSSSSTAVELARRMIARDAAHADAAEARDIALALQRTCRHVSETLRDSLGDDGCNALLSRALARTEAHHPALKLIRRQDERGIHLDGVVAAAETAGSAQATAAVEALLGALMDVLGKLIGEDMAIRIMDLDSGSLNGDKPGTS